MVVSWHVFADYAVNGREQCAKLHEKAIRNQRLCECCECRTRFLASPKRCAMTKVFVGGRLRRLREDRGYSQVGMARELGLSASYYNQIENDERPLTAQLIVRVSELLKVDAQLFADDQEGRLIADMREALITATPEET